MEQIPSWQANWLATNQEIPRILWNPEVHYRNHKRPHTDPTPSHNNPLHASSSLFQKIHFNIIIQSTQLYINADK